MHRTPRWVTTLSGVVVALLALVIVVGLVFARHLNPTKSAPSATCGSTAASVPPRGAIKGMVTESLVRSAVNVGGLTVGSDGNIWMLASTTEMGSVSVILKITTAGMFTDYPIPNQYPSVAGLTLGADGNLWFLESQGGAPVTTGARDVNQSIVAEVSPSGRFSEYPLATSFMTPSAMTTGPDCNLWIADVGTNDVVRISNGTANRYQIPTPNSDPTAIVSGADGNLWLAESDAGRIARVTTSGNITEFPTPDGSEPWGIASGPDGNLWVSASQRMLPGGPGEVFKMTTSGAFTSYPIPSAKRLASQELLRDPRPGMITPGPDGNLWFIALNNLDRITTSGVITQFLIPPLANDTGSSLGSIVSGPADSISYIGESTSSAREQPMVGSLT